MAPNPLFYDAFIEAGLNAEAALLNSGLIKIYTGGQPLLNGAVTGTLLVTLTFGGTAFIGASTSGGIASVSANAITSGVAAATGTAGYFAVLKSDGVTVYATGTVGTSNADLIGASTSITSGVTVSCSAFQLIQPQS